MRQLTDPEYQLAKSILAVTNGVTFKEKEMMEKIYQDFSGDGPVDLLCDDCVQTLWFRVREAVEAYEAIKNTPATC